MGTENPLLAQFMALDIFGNIVKDQFFHLVFPKNIHYKTTNQWKYWLNWSLQLQENKKRKNPSWTNLCAFRCLKKASLNIWVWNYLFLKNYVTSERAVSHIVLYIISSPLLVTKWGFYFELLPIVSSAFKVNPTHWCTAGKLLWNQFAGLYISLLKEQGHQGIFYW